MNLLLELITFTPYFFGAALLATLIYVFYRKEKATKRHTTAIILLAVLLAISVLASSRILSLG